MSGTGPANQDRGRRFRRAAVFLLHWHSDDTVSTKGALQILNEAGIGCGESNWQAATEFVCAVAELAWQMARAPGPESAEEYLRSVARHAAMDEVMGGTQ